VWSRQSFLRFSCSERYCNDITLIIIGCCCREVIVNGVASSEDSLPDISSLPSSHSFSSSAGAKPNMHPRRCNLIKEELHEEDELTGYSVGFDEMKQHQSTNDNGTCLREKLSPSSPSTALTTNTRLLQTVHSMPQLMLNQISEEDEDEEITSSYRHQQPMFSIAGVENFGGCARKANQNSSMKKLTSFQSGPPSPSCLSHGSSHRAGKDASCVAAKVAQTDSATVEADSRLWTAVVGQKGRNCGGTSNKDDSSIVAGHSCVQREAVCQLGLVQSTSDVEMVDDSYSCTSVPCGSTNSLDRRLFQHPRKDSKSGVGRRSIVGAVRKSVSALLGHLSAVGDMTSAKPHCIETWSSCSDLMQASAKLRCTDSSLFPSRNLADRQRVAGCQLARELRQNRSEREALFSDANKSQSSSHVIRVRSRDFDTLVSKFTTGDQTTATSAKSDVIVS